jgi:hypothetical protein
VCPNYTLIMSCYCSYSSSGSVRPIPNFSFVLLETRLVAHPRLMLLGHGFTASRLHGFTASFRFLQLPMFFIAGCVAGADAILSARRLVILAEFLFYKWYRYICWQHVSLLILHLACFSYSISPRRMFLQFGLCLFIYSYN